MEDVSPKLLKMVRDSFQASFDSDSKIKSIYEKIEAGTATYLEANDFAVKAGEHLAKAYKQISAADLPDGKMYYNIANSIIPPTMTNNYDLVSEVATQIQQNLNEEAGIGLKALTPELNQDRIDGIVNRISSEDDFDAIKWILDSPIVDFSQSIIDDSIRRNAEFHGEAGMTPKIVRKNAFFGCCKWCSKLQGTYVYPDVPQDVYRRHQNCRCTVDYHPGNGKKQNVHSREWRKEKDQEEIERRKIVGLEDEIHRFDDYVKNGENVTEEYLHNRYPGTGKIDIDGGYDINEHTNELKDAQWIHDVFGGDITLVAETETKTSDYIWNGKRWELKNASSGAAVNSAVRKGISQIKPNPGGILIDFENYDINDGEMIEKLEKRIAASKPKGMAMDIMFKNGNKLTGIYRYK